MAFDGWGKIQIKMRKNDTPKYAPDMPNLPSRYAQDMPMISPRYASDTPEIYRRYAQDMPKDNIWQWLTKSQKHYRLTESVSNMDSRDLL